jgi:hypothetical protein
MEVRLLPPQPPTLRGKVYFVEASMAFMKTGEERVSAYHRLAQRAADLDASGDTSGANLIRREMRALWNAMTEEQRTNARGMDEHLSGY